MFRLSAKACLEICHVTRAVPSDDCGETDDAQGISGFSISLGHSLIIRISENENIPIVKRDFCSNENAIGRKEISPRGVACVQALLACRAIFEGNSKIYAKYLVAWNGLHVEFSRWHSEESFYHALVHGT